ncbi:hypothetical protein O3M35_007153 [Rhynocoris fuscipes]|uniref:Uncharacterized protein n=1 Tax=Rhynocoris fuscipes TaxID=488301 RepID=A0AAW1DFG1_9HEMI
MLSCSKNCCQVLGKGKGEEERHDNFNAHPNYCIIPGIITNGIMTYGGPAMFLSKRATVPPLLKLFVEEKRSPFDIKSGQMRNTRETVLKNSSRTVANEMLPKWLEEGTIRPDIEFIIKSTSKRSIRREILKEESYSLEDLKEASDMLLPTINSISKYLMIKQICSNANSQPPIFTLILPNTVKDSIKHQQQANNTSCFMTVSRLFKIVKMKLDKTKRRNSILIMVLGAAFVAATSWRLATKMAI